MVDPVSRSVSAQPSSAQAAPQARLLTIGADSDGQRLDNFLMRECRGVPKTHLYKAIRSGEVRVNRGRAKADTRVHAGDVVRIPPLRLPVEPTTAPQAPAREFVVLYEDEHLLVVNKPAGVAVHGGSGVQHGLIEQLRSARPQAPFLELVHRLDRETSGVLVIAKSRRALVQMHDDLRQGRWQKRYLALVAGVIDRPLDLKAPLLRYLLPDGERRVRVDPEGQYAHTVVTPKQQFDAFTLVECLLKTGRTHQIRVHLASRQCPILGDDKYGSFEQNRQWAREGLRRMFLHAASLRLSHPITGADLRLQADLPSELSAFLEHLKCPTT